MTMSNDPHASSRLADARIIEAERHDDPKGKLAVFEKAENGMSPFEVKRVFYLYDVPADSERGGHSHFNGQELIIAIAGSFDVELDDGVERKRWRLDRPYRALYIPTGLWRTIDNFSGGAVCLVLTSTNYSEDDYVRSYERFVELTAPKRIKNNR